MILTSNNSSERWMQGLERGSSKSSTSVIETEDEKVNFVARKIILCASRDAEPSHLKWTYNTSFKVFEAEKRNGKGEFEHILISGLGSGPLSWTVSNQIEDGIEVRVWTSPCSQGEVEFVFDKSIRLWTPRTAPKAKGVREVVLPSGEKWSFDRARPQGEWSRKRGSDWDLDVIRSAVKRPPEKVQESEGTPSTFITNASQLMVKSYTQNELVAFLRERARAHLNNRNSIPADISKRDVKTVTLSVVKAVLISTAAATAAVALVALFATPIGWVALGTVAAVFIAFLIAQAAHASYNNPQVLTTYID